MAERQCMYVSIGQAKKWNESQFSGGVVIGRVRDLWRVESPSK